MTTDLPVFEDWTGAALHVFAQADDIRVTISERPDDDYSASVDIPFADVREVTAAMHEKAGLPDRWAALKDIIFCLRPDGMSGEAYRRYVVESMGRLETGQ